jgi:hypothetical protein
MVTNEEMWTIAWKSRQAPSLHAQIQIKSNQLMNATCVLCSRLAESLRVRLHAAPFVSKNFKQFASQLKKYPHLLFLTLHG